MTVKLEITQYYDSAGNPCNNKSTWFDVATLIMYQTIDPVTGNATKTYYNCAIYGMYTTDIINHSKETDSMNDVFDFFGNGFLAIQIYKHSGLLAEFEKQLKNDID